MVLSVAKKLWIFSFVIAFIACILLIIGVSTFNDSKGTVIKYFRESSILFYISIFMGLVIWLYCMSVKESNLGIYVAIGVFLTIILPIIINYFLVV